MITLRSPIPLFLLIGSFCWIKVRYASDPLQFGICFTSNKGRCLSKDESKLYKKLLRCRSPSLKSKVSTVVLGCSRIRLISSAKRLSTEVTYYSNIQLHSFPAPISASLVPWSKTGGFGKSFHQDLELSSLVEDRASICCAALAAAAAASAA